MQFVAPRPFHLVCSLVLVFSGMTGAAAQAIPTASPAETKPIQRVPRQQTNLRAALVGRVLAAQPAEAAQPNAEETSIIPGAEITLQVESGSKLLHARANADGIFRFPDLAPGLYDLTCTQEGYASVEQKAIRLNPGELLAIELRLTPAAGAATATVPERQIPPTVTQAEPNEPGTPVYEEVLRRPNESATNLSTPGLPANDRIVPRPDRWSIPVYLPQRYEHRNGEFPGVEGHWYDPFNRNVLKGDYPIFGQRTFFNFTGTSISAFDLRRLYVPSNVDAAHPGSFTFFGNGRQTFLAETVRLSFDLFHGDTSFRPVDWRIRITTAGNVNQLWTQERGIVSINPANGTDRTDGHVGPQEAFAEVKLHDFGPNYDFISVRAGIQQFTSDFRGFIFNYEQPGIRFFGNLKSNRYEYNAAFFHLLEKDTNSGLNTLSPRHQQVAIANLFMQDFLKKGYTAEVSYHFNYDHPSIHYDDNGFLVRPAPVGAVVFNNRVHPHAIHSHYLGFAGNGHLGRLNLSNAFYQVFGRDSLNPIAGRPVNINAQMAAVETSVDIDWVRLRGSFFYASGDGNPRDGTARGFDSIADAENFAGGIFSFFNREGIRLTGTRVALTAPESFLPNLRPDKEEGQANYVNPGLLLYNAGADFDLTPNLRAITNVNFYQFANTAPLQLLLFQSHISGNIGTDYSAGLVYRPKLSENITIAGGLAALTPATGLRQIYTGKTLFSGFSVVKFQF